MPKTAIVTGASRGIGKAVVKRPRDGFAVVVNYASNAKEAEATVAEIKSDGGQAIAVKADVGNAADVEQMFDGTVKAFGSIDVVVNNSGIMPLSPIGKADAALFDRVIQTNLRGTFLVMAQAAQRLASGGRFIAFSSSCWQGPFRATALTSLPKPAWRAWFMYLPTKCAAEISPSTPWRLDP